MNRACFPKEKTPEFTKMGEIHELFVFALSLVWFAGATPDILTIPLVSVKFVSAILGPEMGAPILWTPGKKCVLSAGKNHVRKIPLIWVFFFLGGGGKCRFYFYGRADFSERY